MTNQHLMRKDKKCVCVSLPQRERRYCEKMRGGGGGMQRNSLSWFRSSAQTICVYIELKSSTIKDEALVLLQTLHNNLQSSEIARKKGKSGHVFSLMYFFCFGSCRLHLCLWCKHIVQQGPPAGLGGSYFSLDHVPVVIVIGSIRI